MQHPKRSRGVVARTQVWWSPDDGAPPPQVAGAPAFDPSKYDFGWDASRDLWLPARWFQPDTEAWTPKPTITVATAAQDAGLWQEQPGQERSNAQLWFVPDLPNEPIYPTLPIPPTVATVPQQAGLWIDQSGQQDRGIQPTWFTPDLPTEALYPTIPVAPFDPSAGFPWQEQPQDPWIGQFSSPDQYQESFAGPLQSWLFTTGSPSVPSGAQPVVIDATTGNVYVSIGGPFVVPAT